MNKKEHTMITESVTSYLWRAFQCELCKSDYQEKFYRSGRVYHLFEISKPKKNYMVLESVCNTNGGQ